MHVHSLGAVPILVFLVALGSLVVILGRPIGGNDQSTGWGLYRLDFLRTSLSLLACWGIVLLVVTGMSALLGHHHQFTTVWRLLLPRNTTLSLLGVTVLLVALGGFNTYMQTNRPFRLAQAAMDKAVTQDNAAIAALSTTPTVAASVRQAQAVHVAYALGSTDRERLYLATLQGGREANVVVILTVTPRDPLKLWNTYQLKTIASADEA